LCKIYWHIEAITEAAAGRCFISKLAVYVFASVINVPLGPKASLLFVVIGVSMYNSNQKRIPLFEQAHGQDPEAFAQAETPSMFVYLLAL